MSRQWNRNHETVLELIRDYYGYKELVYCSESFENTACAFIDFQTSCNTVLTEREKEIVDCVKMVGENSTSQLKSISISTVKFHLKNATRKICIDLEVKSV